MLCMAYGVIAYRSSAGPLMAAKYINGHVRLKVTHSFVTMFTKTLNHTNKRIIT
jgi:hypothetical protein